MGGQAIDPGDWQPPTDSERSDAIDTSTSLGMLPPSTLPGESSCIDPWRGRTTAPLAGFALGTRGWPGSSGAPNGQGVVLGIRPEDLQPAPASADSGTTIGARVELVELLGGEGLVHVRAGNTELTARMPSPVPATGIEIRLAVPPHKVHLFDADTGARVEGDASG